MNISLTLWVIAPALVSWLLTGIVRHEAVKRNMFDLPNSRSSHLTPTPRFGGLAIFLTSFLFSMLGVALDEIQNSVLLPMLAGGSMVAFIGLMDDVRNIRPILRLIVHFGAVIWTISYIDMSLDLKIFSFTFHMSTSGLVAIVIALVWFLNLFNFMDGIDGIAASEAIFIAISGAMFSGIAGNGGFLLIGVIMAGAVAGFLVWNWPPAKIFMGDSGSGYLGFMLGIYVCWSSSAGVVSIWTWLIISSAFIVDASYTLVRRIIRRANPSEAHRTHAYQIAARKWGHMRVTVGISLVNIVWLLPIAYLSESYSYWSPILLFVAILPLLVLEFVLGAGKDTSLAAQ